MGATHRDKAPSERSVTHKPPSRRLAFGYTPAFKEPPAKFHFGPRAIVSAAPRLIHQRLASVTDLRRTRLGQSQICPSSPQSDVSGPK